jgi:hypothetical protein
MREAIKAERGIERMRGESKDCTVRALACAAGWTYEQAHEHMRKTVNRQQGRGVIAELCEKAYKAAGFELTDIFGVTKKSRYLARIFPNVPHSKGMSFKRLLPELTKGRYIVGIRGHVFAVVNGHVFDFGHIPAKASVTEIYEKR